MNLTIIKFFILTLAQISSAEEVKTYCNSSDEFIKAYEMLKEDKELDLNDIDLIKKSQQIASGCNGAFNRFKKGYLSLKKSGVDYGKAMEMGLKFAQLTDEAADNFYVVFKKSYLENSLDLDFNTAFQISLEIAQVSPDYINRVKEDFSSFTQFCLDQKNIGLPILDCVKLIRETSMLNEVFADKSIYSSFIDLYTYLKVHNRIGLDTSRAIQLSLVILKNGPKSVENFKKIFEYSTNKIKSPITEKQALLLAKEIADLSIKK